MRESDKATAGKSRIRWVALAQAATQWLLGLYALAQTRGQTLSGEAILAAAAAVGGLIAWAIYHAISRRNDGLVILMMALLFNLPRPDSIALPLREELTKQSFPFIILVMLSIIVGLYNRERRNREKSPQSSPLWDAEVDPPSPG